VVAHPVAHGTGNSFPSGHSLGSIVCYGAVFLVFLPAARGRWRTVFTTVIVALVALIGISRILLGVHDVSDVIGGWAIGIPGWASPRSPSRRPGRLPGCRAAGVPSS
jgi:undecaprenyl-diphosphatase